ncbi:MAG: DUF5672 family protein [Cytophagales bacterium]
MFAKNDKKCLVLVPIYRPFTELEKAFVLNNLEKTSGFLTVFFGPQTCETLIEEFPGFKNIKFQAFESHFFKNIRAYNLLMLSEIFYISFSEYEYLLIVQPDAFLFKNEVEQWCDKGFDYIGAPWFRYNKLQKGKLYWWIYKNTYQKYLSLNRKGGWLYNKVGNGGLSLRKTSSFIESLQKAPKDLLQRYQSADWDELNEDVFWSIEVPKFNNTFSIPDFETALKFSVEQDPENAVEIFLKGELPFGCHDPLRQNKEF